MQSNQVFRALRVALAAATAAGVLGAHVAQAQAPVTAPASPSTSATQPMPGNYVAANAPKAHPIRDLFATTIAAVLQTAAGTLPGVISQGINGSITNWFDRRQGRQQQAAYANQYGSAYGNQYADPNAGAYADPNAYPATNANSNPYATNPYATDASNPYAAQPSPAPGYQTAPTPGYDTQAYGSPSYGAQPGQAYPASTVIAGTATQSANALYAGIAYEVRALDSAGNESAVDAAAYAFRSGERFKVYFRPSLPGRMEIYNINPLGQQTRIDAVDMAAGQLTALGPYEFAANKGEESLRLLLTPCTSPQLLAATRDIINVKGGATAQNGMALSSCGAVGTRTVKDRVRTRDIQKVAVEGTTSYALDPVSSTELSSGELAPRETTIRFHHR